MKKSSASPADVCLVLEGTYPYVSGGVSTWVHQIVTALSDVTFSRGNSLVATADKTLEQEVAAKGLTLIPRSQAEKLVNYNGTWPPPPSVITKIAESTGADYVAVGSLNKLGSRISLDCAIFDVLVPQVPHSAFREAQAPDDLSKITGEIVATLLTFSNRGFTVASIAPAGNERIDSGAIMSNRRANSCRFRSDVISAMTSTLTPWRCRLSTCAWMARVPRSGCRGCRSAAATVRPR